MYEEMIQKVQLHLDKQFALPCDLIGEFFDTTKKELIQTYRCAYDSGSTVLVIVQYGNAKAHIHYVDDSFTIN